MPLAETLPGQAARSASSPRPPRRAIPPTATRSALPPAMSRSCTTPAMSPSAWRCGAVVAAAPGGECRAASGPQPGDVVILLGGRTGRDGIGGATGSSKSHDREIACHHGGARCKRATRPRSARSSACSATARSRASSSAATTSARAACPSPSASWRTAWSIDLDAVPQEVRRAWTARSLRSPNRRSAWRSSWRAGGRGAHSSPPPRRRTSRPIAVAVVTESRAAWSCAGAGRRSSISAAPSSNTNGATKHADAQIAAARERYRADSRRPAGEALRRAWRQPEVRVPAVGLPSASTPPSARARVLMPFGGKTPAHAPRRRWRPSCPCSLAGDRRTPRVMAWGCDPDALSADPYRGAPTSRWMTSVAKLVAAGADYQQGLPDLPGVF